MQASSSAVTFCAVHSIFVAGLRPPYRGVTNLLGVDSYDVGTGYGHIALTVDDLDATLELLAEQGIEPERPPYTVREGGSRLCFVRDPDEYQIELIEGSGK